MRPSEKKGRTAQRGGEKEGVLLVTLLRRVGAQTSGRSQDSLLLARDSKRNPPEGRGDRESKVHSFDRKSLPAGRKGEKKGSLHCPTEKRGRKR